MVATPPATDSVVAEFAGSSWFLGTMPEMPIAASGPPIKIGMINQENTPLGSYPELRYAVEAGVAWVNTELGGVDGRPIELISCATPFDPEQSRRCAQRLIDAGVVAFVGGVDVRSDGSYPLIEERGLISVGGIPATLVEQRSPNAYFFSGGDAGALAAFVTHAADVGHRQIAIAYTGEVDSFTVAARDYGAVVGASLGLEVQLVPYSILAAEHSDVVQASLDGGATALMVLAATSACVSVMTAAADVAPTMQLYLTGACAGDDVVVAAGPSAERVVFNAEGPVDGEIVDAAVYRAVIERYATGAAGGAGTVGFRGFMNLFSLLLEVEQVDSADLADLLRRSAGRPSFWGHPYTCDGAQVPGLPALCAPQQVLFTRTATNFTGLGDWIATDELFARAFG